MYVQASTTTKASGRVDPIIPRNCKREPSGWTPSYWRTSAALRNGKTHEEKGAQTKPDQTHSFLAWNMYAQASDSPERERGEFESFDLYSTLGGR